MDYKNDKIYDKNDKIYYFEENQNLSTAPLKNRELIDQSE